MTRKYLVQCSICKQEEMISITNILVRPDNWIGILGRIKKGPKVKYIDLEICPRCAKTLQVNGKLIGSMASDNLTGSEES